MSEAAVLMSGLDTLPSAAGVPASPAGTAPGGGFAGILSESMQGAREMDSPPPAPAATALPAEGDGEGSPQMGKPLPVGWASAEEDVAFLDAFPLEGVPALEVMETGLPVMLPPLPVASAGFMGLPFGGPTQPDFAALPVATSQPNPSPTLTVPGTNPLPAAAATASPATSEPAAAPSAALPAAPPAADVVNPLPPLETAAAGRELRLPDWQALRMARAGGLDSRPAASQVASLNKPEGSASADSQDVLQMLGLRPASASAMPASVDGGRPMMSFLPERFLGEGQTANPSILSTGSDTVSTGAFSTLIPAAAGSGSGALPTVSVATPVAQGNWSQDIGQRVTWLANQEIREAQIQLNPRHLGPVEIRIAYGQEQQLSVSFIAHHPQAREALDAMLPRLREMFDAQGLNLADVSVSQESFTDRRRAAYANGSSKGFNGVGADMEDTAAPPPLMRAVGLFDAYA